MFAEVLVEIKAKSINKTFTYNIPSEMQIKIGMKVLVPFGKQMLEGFVLNIKKDYDSDYKLKDVEKIIDEEIILNEELLKLGEYISKKTLCNLISAYQTMLPTALKAKHNNKINKKYITLIKLNIPYLEAKKQIKNNKQEEIIELLKDREIEKSKLKEISVSSLNTLIKNNIIKEIKKEDYRLKQEIEKEQERKELTLEQRDVINKINSYDNFKPFLLHGVTGSGKTEVYLNLIEKVINEGKEAIVLVPEISLTPQLVNTFKKRFGSKIAVLHSGLSQGEKYDEWRKINRKEVKIVIGARSAIFAPLNNLGIIIIDEEHSATYKQENTPKYNAIDIALWRAKYNDCKIVLGSATPSIESYTRANMNVYELLTMKKRVNNNLPRVTLVDMKDEYKKGNKIISSLLDIKIKEALEKDEQVILFLNRRGYTTITTCHECGYTLKCPNCDIPLTYHKTSNTNRCHYCGYAIGKVLNCPSCNSKDINQFGLGTEKLEHEIKEKYPTSKIVRMDIDTTSKKGSHEKIITDFGLKKYNILIGTQMISKGLDFPSVTVVGVINGDATLNIPDFRSSERTYQLLNQVSGRAGRSKLKGEVIIQGFNIDHYSILYASNNDYENFYKKELSIRKQLKYSPYYNLCLIKIKDRNLDNCFKEGNKIVNYLKNQKLKDVFILGPSTSSIPKINNIFNVQIIIKYKNTNDIINSLEYIRQIYKDKNISIDIDINPYKL